MAIDQERFLKCRSEFLQSLKIHNISNDDAMLLCASALNECLAGTQYSVSIMLVPVVFKNFPPQTEENKSPLSAGGDNIRIESPLEGDFLHEIHRLVSCFYPNGR